MKQQYDVVIHGAGIPGLALALRLISMQKVSLSVLLIDRSPLRPQPLVHAPPQSVNSFDQRVYALTYASKALLQSINVWPGDQAERIYPYRNIHVWDSGGHGEIHFDAAEMGTSSLGYIVEGRVIHDWLVNAVLERDLIDIVHDEELVSIHQQPGQLALFFDSGKQLSTKLVVGADGAFSKVRELAGIDEMGWRYDQQSVVATVETGKDHGAVAWQQFLPEGPLAFLPMRYSWGSIVWSTSRDRAEWLCRISDDEFLEILSDNAQMKSGQMKNVGPRACFPLALRHVRSYTAQRIALVADAAHTVHPLAGQGLNLGLLDIEALSRQLMGALKTGKDPGQRHILRAYERSRKGDNWLMQGAFDALNRLFSNDQACIAWLRNTGLTTVNHMPLLKNALVQKAMGL